MRELSDIESYIDARPDSALVAIRPDDHGNEIDDKSVEGGNHRDFEATTADIEWNIAR